MADREALIEAEANNEEEHNTEDNVEDNAEENEEGKEGENEESIDKTENDQDDRSSGSEKAIKNRKYKSSTNLKRKLYRSYKIQEVIKTGQLILIQVVKEERGNKGAALTSYISLAGKYTVLMPNSTKTKGISKKISTSDDRNKLKQIIDELNVPLEMGLIIRTAGLNKTKNEIKKDYSTLNKLWVEIETNYTSGDGYLDKLCMELVGLPSSRCRPPTRDMREQYRQKTLDYMKKIKVPHLKF